MPNSQTRLLRAAALPDNFTRSLYKIAPYKGCGHGCRYCDGRAERYYVEGDFECDIEIRRNIPQRLEAELPTLRERGIIAFGSGVTDPYQPLEATEGLMGRCAEILADSPFPFPALVMTKSSLALRDLPLWEKVKDRAGFILLVSISSLDESIRRVMEPGASSFQARLDMLKAFKEAGCIVGILAMPLLPGISDNEASIRRLYTACVDIGTDFVLPGGLTLRPGRQKDFFLKSLGSYRPNLLKKTEELYSEEKVSGSPRKEVSGALFARTAYISKEYAMPYLLPFEKFARILPKHDSIHLLFRDMGELYKERGIDTRPLLKSADSFDSWLIGLRRVFRRKRSLPQDWLELRFDEAMENGELDQVIGNERLAHFTKAILQKKILFDYSTLKIIKGC